MAQMPSTSADPVLAHVITPVTVCAISPIWFRLLTVTAPIFVTLNTILHDDELEPAQRLITDLYNTGVDALIVQDMGILELDIPPIELHASTQCDIRIVEKAKFLADVGFHRLYWRANLI